MDRGWVVVCLESVWRVFGESHEGSAPQGSLWIGIERDPFLSFSLSLLPLPLLLSFSPSLPHTTHYPTLKSLPTQEETSIPLTILLSSSKAVCSPSSYLRCCVSHSRFIPDVCSMDSKTTLTHSMVSSWMDRPIVDGRWRVHINGEGGMMVSVDMIAMVTSEASNGRVPWHSYGGSFWNVLPHPAHFVIPVISLLWRKVLECSSSLLTSSSLCPHSLRHPCVLTPMTCLLTHLIVIPDFSLESSHPSHPWLLTLTSLVLPLIPYSVFSHTPTVIALTQVISHSHSHHLCYHAHSSPPVLTSLLLPLTHTECSHTECSHTHRHPWLLTHTTRLTLTHSSPRSLSPHFSECSHPSLVFSHSPSHIECHHTHSHILLTCVTTLSDLTSLVFWESVCSHFHGVVLPPSLLSHCLLSHTLSHPCHPCEHSHGVVLPPSHHSLLLENLCSHSHSHGVVLPPSHHTPTPILVLPLTPIYHVLTHSAPLTSFHLILTTNASPMHHQPSPTLSHPSCLHHIIITSSPLPITYHHQSLPLTPHNTPNPSISLPTLPIVS